MMRRFFDRAGRAMRRRSKVHPPSSDFRLRSEATARQAGATSGPKSGVQGGGPACERACIGLQADFDRFGVILTYLDRKFFSATVRAESGVNQGQSKWIKV